MQSGCDTHAPLSTQTTNNKVKTGRVEETADKEGDYRDAERKKERKKERNPQ